MLIFVISGARDGSHVFSVLSKRCHFDRALAKGEYVFSVPRATKRVARQRRSRGRGSRRAEEHTLTLGVAAGHGTSRTRARVPPGVPSAAARPKGRATPLNTYKGEGERSAAARVPAGNLGLSTRITARFLDSLRSLGMTR